MVPRSESLGHKQKDYHWNEGNNKRSRQTCHMVELFYDHLSDIVGKSRPKTKRRCDDAHCGREEDKIRASLVKEYGIGQHKQRTVTRQPLINALTQNIEAARPKGNIRHQIGLYQAQ